MHIKKDNLIIFIIGFLHSLTFLIFIEFVTDKSILWSLQDFAELSLSIYYPLILPILNFFTSYSTINNKIVIFFIFAFTSLISGIELVMIYILAKRITFKILKLNKLKKYSSKYPKLQYFILILLFVLIILFLSFIFLIIWLSTIHFEL